MYEAKSRPEKETGNPPRETKKKIIIFIKKEAKQEINLYKIGLSV